MKKTIQKFLNKEVVSYIFWGIVTALINLLSYFFLSMIIDYKFANMIAIIMSKVCAFFVNKFFVFHSKCENYRELMLEIIRYALARGSTGLLDFFGLIFMVDIIRLPDKLSKVIVTMLVLLLNYIFAKRAVFKKRG